MFIMFSFLNVFFFFSFSQNELAIQEQKKADERTLGLAEDQKVCYILLFLTHVLDHPIFNYIKHNRGKKKRFTRKSLSFRRSLMKSNGWSCKSSK